MKANILAAVVLAVVLAAVIVHRRVRRPKLAPEDRRGQRGTFLVTPAHWAVM